MSTDDQNGSGPLLLFDGVCNLCNAAVQWVIARDPDATFGFASLQSDAARQAIVESGQGLAVDDLPDSMVLLDDEGIHTRSTSALRIAKHLGFPYSLLAAGLVVPRPIRDAVYRFVARNRYRWFGRRDTCTVPTPELASRFLDADEPRPIIAASDTPRRNGEDEERQSWMASWLTRFAIVYVLVYLAPFPLTLVYRVFGLEWVQAVPGLIPALGWVAGLHGMIMVPVVGWVGQAVFGVEATLESTGSGDRTFNYVDLFVDFVLATTICAAWVAAARRRVVSAKVFDISHVLVRFYLGTTMLSYGWIKLFPLQFPVVGPDRLVQPYGDSSPMGIAWTFLGASVGYQMFAGLCELLGGYLLFWRRTALVGALISAAVMINVAAINYFYDIPVKLFSTHLVLMALFVMAPDVPKLVGLFGFNLPTAARPIEPFWKRKGRRGLGVMAAHLVFIAGLTTLHIQGGLAGTRARGVWSEPSVLDGVYRVESFTQDGVVGGDVGDAARWVRVGIHPPAATVLRASGDGVRMRMVFDEEEGSVSIFDRGGQAPDEPMFAFTFPSGELLRLEGEFEGKHTVVVLRRENEGSLLTDRGYHWINEFPLNR